jgi:tetratricopeptide (TPR) repeat protein
MQLVVKLWLLAFTAAGLCASQTNPGPTVQNHYQRAQEALSRGNYEVAAAEFSAILRQDSTRAEAWANLGTVYYAQARYGEASDAFRKALAIKPSLKGVEGFLGMSEARLGHMDQALPLLEKGFEKPLSSQWKLEAGLLLSDAYERSGEWSKLENVIATLESEFPENTEVLYLSYRIHSFLGSRAVVRLVKMAPDSARLHQITAELLETEGDFPGAVAQYRKALESDPGLPGARRALGIALMSGTNDEPNRAEARRQFEKELSLNPNDALSEYQLGELMWIDNRPDDALRRFRRAIEIHPNFPDALIAASKVLVSTGKAAEGIPLLEKAVALDPLNEVAHYRFAQALQKSGDPKRAGQELAEFRRLRAAMESIRGITRQVQGNRITNQRIEDK